MSYFYTTSYDSCWITSKILFNGISLVATEPAPTITSLSILTPGRIIDLDPIKQLFPI